MKCLVCYGLALWFLDSIQLVAYIANGTIYVSTRAQVLQNNPSDIMTTMTSKSH